MFSFGDIEWKDGERFPPSLDSNIIVRNKHFRLEINERTEHPFSFASDIFVGKMSFCLGVEQKVRKCISLSFNLNIIAGNIYFRLEIKWKDRIYILLSFDSNMIVGNIRFRLEIEWEDGKCITFSFASDIFDGNMHFRLEVRRERAFLFEYRVKIKTRKVEDN